MRKYGVNYYRDFANTYTLGYVDSGELPEGWEQITRKEAEALARRERRRREDDPNFGGYADTSIYPIGMTDEERQEARFVADEGNSDAFYRNGLIVERKG